MRRRIIISAVMFFFMILSFQGCGSYEGIKNEKPVTVTLWHVYGAQTESPMNRMVERFNETVGKEKNIAVKVTSVSNNNIIHENILASAYHDPGAAELPDMFIAYPKTVLALPDMDILADYRDYFTDSDLAGFVPDFLDEGKIDGRQLILPIAKSTEILFINKTVFDRFAKETGAEYRDLETWEGLSETAVKYCRWTDAKTPDIRGDGKAFFACDNLFNYFQSGVESLGGKIFRNGELYFGSECESVWKPYAEAAVAGAVWLGTGYATDPFQTGDAIACTASSASVMYFSDDVTYPDNTSEPAEIISMPVPKFNGGTETAIQRGAGICTVKSSEEKEAACAEFIKWITDPEQNVEFVTNLGYMPVKTDAFRKKLPEAVDRIEDERYISLYDAFMKMQKEYVFCSPPMIKNYLEIEEKFEEQMRLILAGSKAEPESDSETCNEMAKAAYIRFKSVMGVQRGKQLCADLNA